jgi:L-ribulokinase
MAASNRVALGLDFGTESVRAVLVDTRGNELGTAVSNYSHGQITHTLPGSDVPLPPLYALQDPQDWLDSAAKAVRAVVRRSGVDPSWLVGIGVDFTSCTMLPCLATGLPLCQLPQWQSVPLAWPKLWKHHAAQPQTDRINALARQRQEAFLDTYGGIIGLEWFFPKVLETLENAPKVYAATEVWLEAGDWFVWQLVGGAADELPRSTCQAGYKGMWHAERGYPSREFLGGLHPKLADVVEQKMPGRLLAPGQSAGGLQAAVAKRWGVPSGIPVSAAIIDAHAGVPGAGAADPGTLVMVMGTSSCHMLNASQERSVPGVAGIVKDGILPGYYGYETGQAAVGDAFSWLGRLTGQTDLGRLSEAAAQVPAGAEGVVCLDWLHGCRTPLMDGSLRGAFTGLALHHGPPHLYRSLLEASACGVRWIVDLLQEHQVPVERVIATGGLPHRHPLVVQVYADVLGMPVMVHPSQQGPALGAALLGALAGGAFQTPQAAIRAMATPKRGQATTYRPRSANRKVYDQLYTRYRQLADFAAARSVP